MTLPIEIEPHPLLEAATFRVTLSRPLGELASPPALLAALGSGAETVRDEETRAAVRRLLRHGGYRPAGRGKPASEYLVQAAERGTLAPINPLVDACNAASLWGGLPISVVDAERAAPPWRIAIAPEGASYVFNPAGQEIALTGLLCLHDAEGPCANAVKDAQRTKTQEGTTAGLVAVWGTREVPGRAAAVAERYRGWIESLGGTIED